MELRVEKLKIGGFELVEFESRKHRAHGGHRE